MTWQTQAACRTVDPAVFFPRNSKGGCGNYTAAREVCADCPVPEVWLADAELFEGSGFRHGMRGGLTPKERDQRGRVRPRRCVICGTVYVTAHGLVVTCSSECQRAHRNATQRDSHARRKVDA